jgi:CBS domain-containing protein
MKNILVADLMTCEPRCIKPETNLLKCSEIMVKKKAGSLLLVKQKKLVGIISRKDILWALVKKSPSDLSKIRAIDVSPRKIATISPNKTIKEALQKMKKLKFSRLPVIHKKELVGIITIKDILNFHPELYPELREQEQIQEESEKLRRYQKAQKRSSGICEECGNSGVLFDFNGMLVCESCMNSV